MSNLKRSARLRKAKEFSESLVIRSLSLETTPSSCWPIMSTNGDLKAMLGIQATLCLIPMQFSEMKTIENLSSRCLLEVKELTIGPQTNASTSFSNRKQNEF